MCLAVPGKIIEKIDNKQAIVDFDGVQRKVNTILIEKPEVGEYVLVHVGFAIQRVTKKETQESYKVYREIE